MSFTKEQQMRRRSHKLNSSLRIILITVLCSLCIFSCEGTTAISSSISHDDITAVFTSSNSMSGKVRGIEMSQHISSGETTSSSLASIEHRSQRRTDSHENQHIRTVEPWFKVLLATIVINIITLIGILVVVPVLIQKKWHWLKSTFWIANEKAEEDIEMEEEEMVQEKSDRFSDDEVEIHAMEQKNQRLFDIFVPSFVCGILLSTVFFLVLPQALTFIQLSKLGDYDHDVDTEQEMLSGSIARFGTCVLSGFMMPVFLGALFPKSTSPPGEEDENKNLKEDPSLPKKSSYKTLNKEAGKGSDIEENDSDSAVGTMQSTQTGKTSIDTETLTKKSYVKRTSSTFDLSVIEEAEDINQSLCYSILLHDTVNNLWDGMFIGVSFMTCSNSTAVFVVLITMYSEISQKVTDYFLLTKYAGVSIPRALLLNFLSGIAVVVGGMLILGTGVSLMAVGVMLSFAGGVFLHNAAKECLPRIDAVVMLGKHRIYSLLFFLGGALPIGLTLIKHEHCYLPE